MSWLSSWLHGDNHPAAAPAADQTAMMEAQQQKHDAAVTAGKGSIDSAFAQFNPEYFDAYGKSYRDAQNPTLDDQYKRAHSTLMAALAGKDQLEGSTGADALGEQQKTYNDAQADIGAKSVDAQNALKSTVDNQKTSLYGLNASVADPLQMSATAQQTAGAIQAPQSYPSMANVFTAGLQPVVAGATANAQAPATVPRLSNAFNFNAAPIDGSGSAIFSS